MYISRTSLELGRAWRSPRRRSKNGCWVRWCVLSVLTTWPRSSSTKPTSTRTGPEVGTKKIYPKKTYKYFLSLNPHLVIKLPFETMLNLICSNFQARRRCSSLRTSVNASWTTSRLWRRSTRLSSQTSLHTKTASSRSLLLPRNSSKKLCPPIQFIFVSSIFAENSL